MPFFRAANNCTNVRMEKISNKFQMMHSLQFILQELGIDIEKKMGNFFLFFNLY